MLEDFAKLSLRKFKIKNILPDATILILGRRRSGKSWLVRDIFFHHQHIPSGVVFSGTEEASPFFGDFIPDCFIHPEYDPELIENLLTKQKKKFEKLNYKENLILANFPLTISLSSLMICYMTRKIGKKKKL